MSKNTEHLNGNGQSWTSPKTDLDITDTFDSRLQRLRIAEKEVGKVIPSLPISVVREFSSSSKKADDISHSFIIPILEGALDEESVTKNLSSLMLVVGAQLIIAGEYEKMQQVGRKYGFTQQTRNLIDAYKDVLPSEILDTKYRTNVAELIESKNPHKAVDTYTYIMDCIAEEQDDQKVELGDLSETELKHYSTIRYVSALALSLISMSVALPENITYPDEISSSKFYKPAREQANLLLKKMSTIKKEWKDALINPQNPSHEKMISSFNKYLENENGYTAFVAIDILFGEVTRNKEVKEIYRTLRKLSDEDEYSYLSPLCETFFEYSDKNTDLNIEGETFIVDEYKDYPFSIDNLKTQVTDVCTKTRRTEYELNPSEIDWELLPEPAEITVSLNENNPLKIKLNIGYLTQYNDIVSMEIFFDLRKGKEKMDWNFLESPDDPRMQAFKGAILKIMEKSITEVRKIANEDERIRHESKTKTIATCSDKTKKSNGIRQNLEQPISRKRKNHQGNLVTKTDQEQSQKTTTEIGSTYLRVNIPTDEEWTRIIKNLDQEDMDHAIRAIERFNKNNSQGNFRATRLGEGIFRLKAGRKLVILLEKTNDGLSVKKIFPRKIDYDRGFRGVI